MSAADFEAIALGVNVLVLLITAWIKIDVLSLKVYMHEKFVTREEYNRMLRAFGHQVSGDE